MISIVYMPPVITLPNDSTIEGVEAYDGVVPIAWCRAKRFGSKPRGRAWMFSSYIAMLKKVGPDTR